jgi:hypothetical protein
MVATPKTVLLQVGERKRRRDDGRPESRSDTEDDMDELTLSTGSLLGTQRIWPFRIACIAS